MRYRNAAGADRSNGVVDPGTLATRRFWPAYFRALSYRFEVCPHVNRNIIPCPLLRFALTLVLGAGAAAIAGAQAAPPVAQCPPHTRVDNITNTYGSTVVADPYQWLEDQNSPETRAWIGAEDSCTDAALSKIPGRDAIATRLADLYHADSYSLPTQRDGRYFFTKLTAGQDLSQIFMRVGRAGRDEVLVDPLSWSTDHSVSASLEAVSRDGKFVFYGRREGGQDEITVHVLSVETRRDLPDVLPSAVYFSVTPTPDDRGIYYSIATPAGPRAYYHAMGTDAADDKIIFGNGLGKDKGVGVDLSDDGEYLLLTVVFGTGSAQSALYMQNVKDHGPIVTVVDDIVSQFYGFFAGHTLYITTNWKAPHWHVFAAALGAPSPEHWREVVPETDAVLDGFAPVGGKLVVEYLRNATSEIEVFDADGKNPKPLSLPALGTASIAGRWESPELFYAFTSFNYPTTNFVYDLAASTSAIWSKLSVPFDPGDFETRQVWYESKDKTRVSMFLFYKKGLQLDGNNPVLLTGYGGFDISETPAFMPRNIVWAEHGGVLALANLRGGGEYGEEWHQAGMFGRKQNVFDDFIAAAEYLIASKYTTASKLSIIGSSNGGLLVGAAITQRPDLFQAAICGYPLLDMLRYQKFMEAAYWVPEYGSSDNPDQFGYLYKYSPYQNVVPGTNYPATLFITGDGDTRVAPLHARKMAARLQAATSSARPILLLYDTKSGHSGGRPISKIIEENRDVLSFLFWQLGVSH
jgi:prolyl oligopeptidase